MTFSESKPPPVPPKESGQISETSHTRIRQRRPHPPPKDDKPLPNAPQWKPLPAPPSGVRDSKPNHQITLLWLVGFFVCFLLIVVLLPVIMEREAMINTNAYLSNLF